MPISGREDGFTLAEMLLVVAITALAAGLVVGRGTPGQARIDRSALAAWLRGTRAEAMRTDRFLAVEVGKDGYSLVAGPRVLALGPDRDVRIEGQVAFGPDGSSQGGLVRVRSKGAEDRLVVQPVTGAILP